MKAAKWHIVLSIITILILAAPFSSCTMVGQVKSKVAVIPLSGTIVGASQQGMLATTGISTDLVRSQLKKAKDDLGVKAVVLRIDSPGGSAAASQEIASEIRRFKDNTGKPVVVSMGDTAASGGYYISVYADKIVANPSTLTGSIGVISQIIYIEGLLEKLGLKMETIKSGEHKDMGIRPLTDEERQIMQDITDDLYEQFVLAVAEGRSLPVADVKKLATGQLYTGEQALKLGLVDELGGVSRAIELAASLAGVTAPEVEEYRPSPSLFEKLLEGFSSSSSLPFSEDELLFLRTLEGWQVMPRY